MATCRTDKGLAKRLIFFRPASYYSFSLWLALGNLLLSAQSLDLDHHIWTGRTDATSIESRVGRLLARQQTLIETLVNVSGQHTIQNTLKPYDQAVELLDAASNQCQLIQAVHPDIAVRSRAESLVQRVAAATTALSLNENVYEALAATDVSHADGPTRYYIQRTLLRFNLAGVGRDPAARAHIRVLNDDIARLSAEFHRNLQEDVRKIRITSAAELDGLPPDFMARHKPAVDGSITLTTDMPDVSPVLQFANNDGVRQRVYVAYNNRGYPKNISVLSDLLQKRQELAEIVGYRNWADMAAADKMAGSPATVREFLNQLDAASRSSARREFDLMLRVARKRNSSVTTISVADVDYWSGQVVQQLGFDPESVRPYFPYERVQQGVLDMASRLFHISFHLVPGADVWDTSVTTFDVFDSDRRLGRIYLDMHPRSGKDQWYSAATVLDGGQGELPEAALICNFGGGTASDPGLMGSGAISTFLHEFGHLLHALFQGQQQWSGFANNTESDFAEAPSQMLENFLEDSTVLARFAKHYQTNKPIPPALVRRMIQTSSFRRPYIVRALIADSLACLDLHTDRRPSGTLEEVWRSYHRRVISPYRGVKGDHGLASFFGLWIIHPASIHICGIEQSRRVFRAIQPQQSDGRPDRNAISTCSAGTDRINFVE